ncbi:hypothetical protein SAMN05444008_12144 [Cnuella takakiae]|uniref:Uncharacterized protein n=1 Tax=Cnuella takakiae TaxID=1302690 RepID=A0A1M5I2G9_9BACT|nr:hypothetical protein SAMN05444008_12144 [Cnuella takakiae]
MDLNLVINLFLPIFVSTFIMPKVIGGYMT